MKKFFVICVFFFAVLSAFHGRTLFDSYTLSGDDLFMISEAPDTWQEILYRFTDFKTTYRPAGRFAFHLYRALEPNFKLIYFVHLFFIAGVTSLLYLNLSKFLGVLAAVGLALVVVFSPVFYYQIFATASLHNLIMLASHLGLMLLVNFGGKKFAGRSAKPNLTTVKTGFAIFVFSIFVKESFLVNSVLLSMVAWQNLPDQERFKNWLGTTWGITLGYLIIHFYFYIPTINSYEFIFTLAKLKENVILLASWLLNYPKGWQYGAPLPKDAVTYLVTGGTALFWAGACWPMVRSFRVRWQQVAFFGLVVATSITPFLFLVRILVYYLDATVLLMTVAAGYGLSLYTNKRVQRVFILLFVGVYFIHYWVITPQWHQYSFVAVANEIAHNFLETLDTVDWHRKEKLCVTNHGEGMWATEYGNLTNHLQQKYMIIHSVDDLPLPKDCDLDSLILENTGREYSVVRGN